MLTWRGIADELRIHRTRLLQANLIALLAVAAAVPVPLLLPLMVDEVLLRVEATFAKENEERELIASGMPIDEVYKKFGVL